MLKLLLLLQLLLSPQFMIPDIAEEGFAPCVVESSLLEKIESFPGVLVEEITANGHFEEAYAIRLTQPLDHGNPDGGTFSQRIYLSHAGYDRPMVINTEGYAADRNSTHELSPMLGANQIIVEHRYFGKSRPDPVEWRHLTVRQAAADHHRVISLFKTIYIGKWVSTGISKGGQTALFHRRYYPEDVDATVPYVAPVNLALEEPRITKFLANVGDAACREKLKKFQIMLLENRKEILPLFRQAAKKNGYNFSIGEELAFEFIVLEYPFSFWQFGSIGSDAIPSKGASPKEMFNSLKRVVPIRFFSDSGASIFEPFFYQSTTEIGYYGYDIAHLKDLLTTGSDYCYTLFAPKGVEVEFDAEVMRDVHSWLTNEGNNIIYLYGEVDPWSASAVEPAEKTNALMMVKKGGSHRIRIRDFKGKEREAILSALEEWLDVTIERRSY